jgi:hypothetical protein
MSKGKSAAFSAFIICFKLRQPARPIFLGGTQFGFFHGFADWQVVRLEKEAKTKTKRRSLHFISN